MASLRAAATAAPVSNGLAAASSSTAGSVTPGGSAPVPSINFNPADFLCVPPWLRPDSKGYGRPPRFNNWSLTFRHDESDVDQTFRVDDAEKNFHHFYALKLRKTYMRGLLVLAMLATLFNHSPFFFGSCDSCVWLHNLRKSVQLPELHAPLQFLFADVAAFFFVILTVFPRATSRYWFFLALYSFLFLSSVQLTLPKLQHLSEHSRMFVDSFSTVSSGFITLVYLGWLIHFGFPHRFIYSCRPFAAFAIFIGITPIISVVLQLISSPSFILSAQFVGTGLGLFVYILCVFLFFSISFWILYHRELESRVSFATLNLLLTRAAIMPKFLSLHHLYFFYDKFHENFDYVFQSCSYLTQLYQNKNTLDNTKALQNGHKNYSGDIASRLLSSLPELKNKSDDSHGFDKALSSVSFTPVFITGLHRSGTTFLYEQLSNAIDRFEVPSLSPYTVLYFPYLLTSRFIDCDENAKKENLTHYFQAMGMYDRLIDKVPVTAEKPPEEYGFILNNFQPFSWSECFSSLLKSIVYSLCRISSTTSEDSSAAPLIVFFEKYVKINVDSASLMKSIGQKLVVMQNYASDAGVKRPTQFVVDRIGELNPHSYVLLKNPWCYGNETNILRLFPNSKFVHLQRDPVQILNSMVGAQVVYSSLKKFEPYFWTLLQSKALACALLDLERIVYAYHGDDGGTKRITEKAMERQMMWMTEGIRSLQALPSEHIVHLHYDALISQPTVQLRRVLSFLQLSSAHLTERQSNPRPFKPLPQVSAVTQSFLQTLKDKNLIRVWEQK